MKVRTKESRKRLGSLILLVAFASILFITSTFAWFSTQKDVTLSNLKGKVNVAEGLEISMDGETWSQEITFDPAQTFDHTLTSGKNYLQTIGYTDNKNVSPVELLPVSTTAYGSTTIGKDYIQMLRGTNTNGIALSAIAAVQGADPSTKPEDDTCGYFAFDIFLRNTSRGSTAEKLQLNKNSSVSIPDATSVGLENTVRVGFALYNQTAEALATASDIIANTVTATTISDVAIWEPNADRHDAYIVKNNNRITPKSLIPTAGKNPSNDSLFTAAALLPTYAINSTAIGNSITDIYDWDTTSNSYVTKQNTLQTTASEPFGSSGHESALDLKSAKDGTTDFTIAANKISRIRVYVWLEGQDVDCTNYASHGSGITVNLGLEKPATT